MFITITGSFYMLPLKQKLESIINILLEDTLYELLTLAVARENSGFNIVAVVDYKNREQKISIDDCTLITKKIQLALEEYEAETEFFINVESPGIDRLLFNKKDYENHKGLDIKLKLHRALEDNSMQLKAEILNVLEESVIVSYKNKEQEIEFANISQAKVLFNDKLIKKLNIFNKK